MNWTDDAKERATVEEVAVALGLAIRQKGTVRGFTCPIHGRDHKDGKPSGRIVYGGQGWRCWTCDIGGTGVTLACYILTGQRKPEREAWFGVRDWFAARGWCEPFERNRAHKVALPPVPKPPPLEELPPLRLPESEVAQLWADAWPVFTEQRAARWIRARSWAGSADHVMEVVSSLNLARALSPHHKCPPWAGGERWAWSTAGFSLLLPCYDSDGRMAALRARWTGTTHGPGAWPGEPPDGWTGPHGPNAEGPAWEETAPPFGGKEVSPSGTGLARGVVYADPVGRWLLGGRAGPIDPKSSIRWDGRVVIVEGGPAFLWYATQPGRVKDGRTHAILGVWSGAWPTGAVGRAFAQRCRVANEVSYAPDDDDGGDAIMRPVRDSLFDAGHGMTILGGAR